MECIRERQDDHQVGTPSSTEDLTESNDVEADPFDSSLDWIVAPIVYFPTSQIAPKMHLHLPTFSDCSGAGCRHIAHGFVMACD